MRRTLLHKQLLVVHNRDALPRQVPNALVLHFPQLLGHLRDETCWKQRQYIVNHGEGGCWGKEAVRTEVVRDDDYTTLELLDRTCERIDGHHVQMVRRLICRQRRVAR